MRSKFQTSDFDKVLHRLQRQGQLLARKRLIKIKTGASTHTAKTFYHRDPENGMKWVPYKTEDVYYSARDNAEKLWINYHMYKRNPWFWTVPQGNKLIKLLNSQLGPVGSESDMDRAAELIGEEILKIFKANVKNRRSYRNAMPKNTKGTAIKLRKGSKPPLINTGGMVGSLKTVWRKI